MEYGTKWTHGSYPKENMMASYKLTTMKFITRKGAYHIYECSNGAHVVIFSDQVNLLKLVQDNPHDLFALGILEPTSRYYSYQVSTELGDFAVTTVARLMPIMQGTEEQPRTLLTTMNFQLPNCL